MKFHDGVPVYSAPKCEEFFLDINDVLCQSNLVTGGDGEPGTDPGFGDDFII